MSNLNLNDLPTTETLDAEAMEAVQGGLNAVVYNSQQANQIVTGGLGPIQAVNAPVSAPVTNLVENNPETSVDMDVLNLIGSHQNLLRP